MSTDYTLIVSTSVGIPLVIYCLVLGALAFRADNRDWLTLEASAIQKEFEKKSKSRLKFLLKFTLLYVTIGYEFFQLMSFGLDADIPWKLPRLSSRVEGISLVPQGEEFSFLFMSRSSNLVPFLVCLDCTSCVFSWNYLG